MTRARKKVIVYDGNSYVVRSQRTEVPDLAGMDRLTALLWLNRNTYAHGYSRDTNPLRGLGDVVAVTRGVS